jgi:hypothetical protein
MATQWLGELWTWWNSLSREMLFFFSIPFVVAAVGLLAHEYRQRVHR